MTFSNETSLIVALKKGEQGAVEKWYRESKTTLLRFFVQQTGNEADSAELVHDTYLSCLSALPLFRGQSQLYSWMLGIARHELADYWRKRYAKKAIKALPFGEELLATSLAEAKSTADSENRLSDVLNNLPQEIAELLQLKYIDGKSVKELADLYGLSFAAMQSRLYRAKELFKEHYERKSIS